MRCKLRTVGIGVVGCISGTQMPGGHHLRQLMGWHICISCPFCHPLSPNDARLSTRLSYCSVLLSLQRLDPEGGSKSGTAQCLIGAANLTSLQQCICVVAVPKQHAAATPESRCSLCKAMSLAVGHLCKARISLGISLLVANLKGPAVCLQWSFMSAVFHADDICSAMADTMSAVAMLIGHAAGFDAGGGSLCAQPAREDHHHENMPDGSCGAYQRADSEC